MGFGIPFGRAKKEQEEEEQRRKSLLQRREQEEDETTFSLPSGGCPGRFIGLWLSNFHIGRSFVA